MPFPFPISAVRPPRTRVVETLTYSSDGDTNGLFYFIGTQDGLTSWSDPQARAIYPLVVTASGILGGSEEGVGALSDRTAGHFYTLNVPNSWVRFDLGPGRRLTLNAYTYRSRSGFNGDHPTAWKLEGSNDGISWTLIDTQPAVSFSATDQWLTTAVVGQTVGFRFFKWTQTALNSGTNNYFVLGEAELYGDFSYLP